MLGHLLHTGRAHHLQGRRGARHIDFNAALGQLALAQLLAKALASGTFRLAARLKAELTARRRHQNIQHSVFGGVQGAFAHLGHLGAPGLLDGDLGQVADDGVHILADIANLSELGGFNFDERCIRQPRESSRDLGFADPSGADHQDVFGRDLGAQAGLDLLAAPAVAQRNRHGTLGLGLADDVPVKFSDDVLWRHGRVSMVWFMLV